MRLAVHRTVMLLACLAGAVAQTPIINAVLNQASLTTPVTPGMPVVIRGANFGNANTSCPGPKVPLVCGSVSATVNGKGTPVRWVSVNEITTYIPSDQPLGQAAVVIRNYAGLSSNTFSVAVQEFSPGIQQYGDVSQTLGFFSDMTQRPISRSNPAVPGQELILYATGLGRTNPVVPEGEMGNAFAVMPAILWLGSRQLPLIAVTLGCGVLCEPGNFLVRFLLPPDVPPGDHLVNLEAGGRRSNTGILVVGLGGAAPSIGYVQSMLDPRVRTLSPGTMMSLVGGGFLSSPGPTGPCLSDPAVWPTQCQGLKVIMNGLAAPIQMVAPNVINFQVPFEVSPGPATINVERTQGGQMQRSNQLAVTVDDYSPTLPANPQSSYAVVIILDTNGPASPANPLMPGDTVHLYMSGLGQTNPPMVTGFSLTIPVRTRQTPVVRVGGKPLENVVAEVLPMMIGQSRVTARVPAGLGAGDLPIVVEIAGKKSQDGLLVPVASQTHIGSAANAASGIPEIASGSWVSLYGRSLSSNRREWTEADIDYDWLPTILDGVEVSIANTPAVVSYISPTQLNVLAPDNLPQGPVEVTVKCPLGWQKSTIVVKPYAPGLFQLQIPPGIFLVALHADWSYVARPGMLPPSVASRPARPGETIIFYGTGFGPTNPPAPYRIRFTGSAPLAGSVVPRVQIGPAAAQVDYVGMVGNGLYQLNVVVPNLPDGDHEVIVSLGSSASPRGKLIPVQR